MLLMLADSIKEVTCTREVNMNCFEVVSLFIIMISTYICCILAAQVCTFPNIEHLYSFPLQLLPLSRISCWTGRSV